jgi:poly(hydroxyalkanoate) depolymerase family esterase
VDLWGVTRYYQLFVPGVLPANPALLMMLHGTQNEIPPANPTTSSWGWQSFANLYGFILVQPASTYNPNAGAWNWNNYFMDASFAPGEGGTCTSPPATSCPDDAGFLRQLIVNLTSQYNLDPNQIFVTGFSSGAQMSERVGVEISDLVAAIAPTSGQMEGQQAAPPPVLSPQNALAPISVQEWHGTVDKVLPPCGYGRAVYSNIWYYLDTVDDTFNYWVSQNQCSTLQTTQTLCTDGEATPDLSGNVATECTGDSNIEVQFIWEQGLGHAWKSNNNAARWQFLSSHPKSNSEMRKERKEISLSEESRREP